MFIETLNIMDKEAFVELLGAVFEHSPWVAEAVHGQQFESVDELYQKMVEVVHNSSVADKKALLNAHPELASRDKMSKESVGEQKGVGLDQVSADEFQFFFQGNADYINKFGFPFIIFVKNKTIDQISNALADRIQNTPEQEFKTALNEVYKIARHRLVQIFS